MPWPNLPPGIRLPPHVYVPGKNARHPEDWFDLIKASVTPDIPSAELHRTTAFQTGLAYLQAGYFWECHEVLEAVWMQTSDPSPEREMVQALIQLANARLKLLMGKPRAARRLCDMVQAHLTRCDQHKVVLGMGIEEVRARLAAVRADAEDAA
ncbi:DUF309 domain-containing protein [uncultured Roseobacter sp.]|uniref:DUF309 domain-containing protein n=1 Tax=uncultured Roseobacter sp. TaxID=114847 RepID=UPI00261C0B90|nr:DUF309 domain-containing protein [uncultured Roseobacter sp.]